VTTIPVWMRATYLVEGFFPRARQTSIVEVSEDVAIAVSVIAEDDAPVAARLNRRGIGDAMGVPRDQLFLWRRLDGRLYRSLLASDGAPLVVDRQGRPNWGGPGRLEHAAETKIDDPLNRLPQFHGPQQRPLAARRIPAEPAGGLRLPLVTDRRAEAMAGASARSQEFILVGDQLYVESPPPVLGLHVDIDQLQVLVVDYDSFQKVIWTSDFDRAPDLQILSDAIAARRGHAPLLDLPTEGEIDVVSDLPSVDGRIIASRRLANRLIDYFMCFRFNEIDPPTVECVACLRLGVRSLERAKSQDDVERELAKITDAVTRLAALNDEYDFDEMYEQRANYQPKQREYARGMAQEWLLGCEICPPRKDMEEDPSLLCLAI